MEDSTSDLRSMEEVLRRVLKVSMVETRSPFTWDVLLEA